MIRYRLCVWAMFALGFVGCTQDAPRTRPATAAPQVAMRGPQSKIEPMVRPSQATICECDMTCSSTGEVFGASANTVATACGRARFLCRGQCNGGTCTQTFGACE